MHSPSFSEFRALYLEALNKQGKLILDQIEACETCTCKDYAYCTAKCTKLRATVKALKKAGSFPWITRKSLFRLYTLVKTQVLCRVYGIEVEPELTVPEIGQVPHEDRPVIGELLKLFSGYCKACTLPKGRSCFECPEIEALRKKLTSQLGQRLFNFLLTVQAEAKRELQRLDKEVLYYYQRLYQPPVKVDYFPVDPWGIFSPKLFSSLKGN